MTAPRDVKVVRWHQDCPEDDDRMCADTFGEWVKYEDHARALADVDAENERLRGECQTRAEDYETLTQMWRSDEAAYRARAETVEAALAAATARLQFVLGQMDFENSDDPDSGKWYSHAYLKDDAIRAPGSPYYKSAEEIIDAALAGKGATQ